ncbi:hypothetical protein SMACR_03794 [Sordaria macrospora]|uniref:WGS project CABT00000000 data, contig 2.16 n=2 Tax=Sordaria macrospora TaxID=5147 RepID=F7VZY8_SORMK|nr:uncharacterized protein SMAC_03794 [Sordaria macrospora k-hell]KAA8636568.1 hypothetical protein SMACR_03794 [Sordaria macrospora]KAH7631351.1 hypothetical protein B0T09DRAFT_320996 [Sordaria sp. MPI-SDFR-AT-0083]WPJ61567.1 hypothetical protein SMAC4_03794 [Sordaria macrospora]CCC11087.1 unnamed protein product [Sordaria macrospora k-hell]
MSGQNNNNSASCKVTLTDLYTKLAVIEARINNYHAKWERIPCEIRPDLSIWRFVSHTVQQFRHTLDSIPVDEHDAFKGADEALDTAFPHLQKLEDDWNMNTPPGFQY